MDFMSETAEKETTVQCGHYYLPKVPTYQPTTYAVLWASAPASV